MCEKAVEIRANWVWESGDFVYDFTLEAIGDHTNMPKSKSTIWLPRQDQLQEMCAGGCPGGYMKMLVKICGWDGVTYSSDWAIKFKSMEQLWLAFVMKEKYNKTWNGKEWVN